MPVPSAVAIAVSDMEKSLRFYRSLGLEFAQEDPRHHHCISPGSIPFMLNDDSLMPMMGVKEPMGENGRASLAVRCADAEEVDRIYGIAASDGYGLAPPWDAFWGQHYAVIRDPDGTRIDLYCLLSSDS